MIFLVMSLLTGCAATSVKGTVAGESVPNMGSGFWYTYEGRVYAQDYDFPDACERVYAYYEEQTAAYVDYLEDFDSDALYAALAESEIANFPERHTSVGLYLTAEPGDDGEYEIGGPEGSFGVTFKDGYTDWAAIYAGNPDETSVGYWAEGGEATIIRFDDEGTFSAKGDADIDSDEVSFTLRAEFCEAFQQAYSG